MVLYTHHNNISYSYSVGKTTRVQHVSELVTIYTWIICKMYILHNVHVYTGNTQLRRLNEKYIS